MKHGDWVSTFVSQALAPGDDLATPALLIARIEYPRLDPRASLELIDAIGEEGRSRVQRLTPGASLEARVTALASFLFDELGFTGNDLEYNDPRSSCLNEVLERRMGLPITLSMLFLEVARRANIPALGVGFPGHFLVRVPATGDVLDLDQDLIVDPFNRGALLSPLDCLALLRRHGGDDARFEPSMLAAATKVQILERMLINLKRLYVRFRSYPQARRVTDLLIALDPNAADELRDRGLMASRLGDPSAAIADLERYLGLVPKTDDEEQQREMERIWEHIKTLRKQLAALN